MSELSRKRNKLMVEIRRRERHEYITKMRQEMLALWREQKETTEIQDVLKAAFIAQEERNGPKLDIYVNIEDILFEINCINSPSLFASRLGLFLYLKLTQSDEVITYMIEKDAIKEWERLTFLLKFNSKCDQLLYQRMRVFLQLICAKYNIQEFHNQQLFGELRGIFSEEFSSWLMEQPIKLDQESQQYGFIEVYIKLMPRSHLRPLFLSGFASSILMCGCPTLSIALKGKIESARQEINELDEFYEKCSQMLQENMIKNLND